MGLLALALVLILVLALESVQVHLVLALAHTLGKLVVRRGIWHFYLH